MGLVVVLSGALLACPWRSQAEPTYPGLPEPAFQPGGFIAVSQVGLSETAKARQWVSVPALTATAWSGTVNSILDPEPGVRVRQGAIGDAFFVSPPGAPAPTATCRRYGSAPSVSACCRSRRSCRSASAVPTASRSPSVVR
ncbi:hypothetical protein [Nocardioides humi]|uniref:hypothetical protein n=1 Tax=Nocardioides humi TaxID=449461 RepID=UPI001127519B|nr:hypothetical protein [Nocardioides humi]